MAYSPSQMYSKFSSSSAMKRLRKTKFEMTKKMNMKGRTYRPSTATV